MVLVELLFTGIFAIEVISDVVVLYDADERVLLSINTNSMCSMISSAQTNFKAPMFYSVLM